MLPEVTKASMVLLAVLTLVSCQSVSYVGSSNQENEWIHYVNPFIGTGGHGHTYPGATMPFGMMQISPDTRLDGWDGCSGYHYSDHVVYGFSHTHLSGTGVSDYADILLMPSRKPIFNSGSNGKPGYRDFFSHDKEVAEPGYYQVYLDSSGIVVGLTASNRSGIQRYEFPSRDSQYVILDLHHRDKLLAGKIKQLNPRELNGIRFSESWAKDQRLFFHIRFSTTIKNIKYQDQNDPKVAAIELDNPENAPVFVYVGISAVDEAGAKRNMELEIGNLTFEEVKKNAQASWNQQLGKIELESHDKEAMFNFYTALYHTMLAPNLYQDIDGRYRGMDLAVHQTKDFDYYTVFSLWDTYRAAHPLYTIIEQKRTNDFINTMLAKYQEGGIMPIWDLSANYTGCMIGYHAVPVIADAYLKNIRGYDPKLALEAMKHSATRDKLGLDAYKKYGFIPVEAESESVSKTLEYAYDDWTIAVMAKKMGLDEDYNSFIKRAQNYKNVFDPDTKFMRGRIENKWFAPFDPYEVNFNYTEANAWQYSYYVPQDISGYIQLLGGKSALESRLDALFTANKGTSGRDQADITGLIGQYAHGNEPSHHIAYLYNFVNKPYKTQERVHQVLTSLYSNEPDGICGNED
ncbi:MAG TPA: GH92 family glycosyl hydrolase, partial [Saprospiraceae bacterium]|nr:GH92 family glycosyl hydrolase [Saprospiraceae bacterium]